MKKVLKQGGVVHDIIMHYSTVMHYSTLFQYFLLLQYYSSTFCLLHQGGVSKSFQWVSEKPLFIVTLFNPWKCYPKMENPLSLAKLLK